MIFFYYYYYCLELLYFLWPFNFSFLIGLLESPRTGVSSPAPEGLLPCRVQLQPQLNILEPANQHLTSFLETSRQVF